MSNSKHLWPDEWLARLKELLREHWSARVIAERMTLEFRRQFTRCAIIGKTHRTPGEKLPGNREDRKPVACVERAKPRHRPKPPPVPVTINPPPPPVFAAPVTQKLPEPGQCRWPIGTPTQSDFGYCPERALPGRPYCACHCGMAYVPTRPVRVHHV